MSSSKCAFNFENNAVGVYYAGQMVSGTVELITTKPKTIRSMHVTIRGFSEVRWTETVKKASQDGQSASNVNEPFTAEECYLSAQTYVYGQSGGGQLNLPPGRYTYPFQVMLPPNCPTSMNGEFGQVRYEAVFTIDRPHRYDNVFKQAFTVILPVDLSPYANRIEAREEKTFCCGFCCGEKNPILVEASVPQNGYASGQVLNFRVLIDNQSNTDCTDVKGKLFRKGTYTCRTPEQKARFDEIRIGETKLGPVPKLMKKDLNGSIVVPPTTPSTLGKCSIINIEYSLMVTVKISGMHMNLHMTIPIVIGTAPLSGNGGGPITNQPGMQVSMSTIPTPQYMEDVNKMKLFVTTDVYHKTAKEAQFFPKYPVYSFGENSVSGQNLIQSPHHPSLTYPGTGPVSPLPSNMGSPYPNQPQGYMNPNQSPYAKPNQNPYPSANVTPYPPAHPPYPIQNNADQSNMIGWNT